MSAEGDNLLDFGRGAAVVSRTGEATLDSSALRAIDGDPSSAWLPPPDDPRQSLLFSLPARAHVTQVGVQTSAKPSLSAREVQLELSPDGTHFIDAGTFHLKPAWGVQFFSIQPVDVAYVRLNTIDGGQRFMQIRSLVVRGALLERERPGKIEGCWSMNGVPAAFAQKNAHVFGFFGQRDPILLDGGSDGRLYRFAWVRGPQYGLAAITVTPDGRHVSGAMWNEEAIPLFFGDAWYGERKDCNTAPEDDGRVMKAYLARVGRFPLYSLRFDEAGRLDETESEATLKALAALLKLNSPRAFRFVGHEFSFSAQRNRVVAQAKLDTLRQALRRSDVDVPADVFIAAGSERPRAKPESEVMRALYGCVELEVVR